MNDAVIFEFKNIDPEDVSNVLLKIEKSFGFKFRRNELSDVKTFGGLCDVIANKVKGDKSIDCTTQQAFYKLRNALAQAQNINKDSIKKETELEDILPRQSRIINIKKLQAELGSSIVMLKTKAWITSVCFIGIILSLLLFFVKWKLAIAGLCLFIVFGLIANRFFATEFACKTVGQLAIKLTRENYLSVRRNPLTVNKSEVVQIVKDIFREDLNLEESVLTREATFD